MCQPLTRPGSDDRCRGLRWDRLDRVPQAAQSRPELAQWWSAQGQPERAGTVRAGGERIGGGYEDPFLREHGRDVVKTLVWRQAEPHQVRRWVRCDVHAGKRSPGDVLTGGGGCEITEAAPLAIAAEHATFAKPEITLGFPPPFGGSQRLPRHVGRKRGLEMILTGDPIPASRAAEIGLVNAIVPADELLGAARNLAARISRHAPTAVAACLRAVTRGINLPIDEGLAVEAASFAATVPTDGVRTGLRRFLDRSAASG